MSKVMKSLSTSNIGKLGWRAFPIDGMSLCTWGTRPTRARPSCSLSGEDASINAVAKVPLTSAAGEAILNEAHVLRHMQTADDLPRVLFDDAQRGVAAQTFLDGKAVSRKFTPRHVELLGRLVNEGATTRLSTFRPEIVSALDAARFAGRSDR